MTESKAKKIF
jgi:serine/threonine protein kinase